MGVWYAEEKYIHIIFLQKYVTTICYTRKTIN